MRNYLKYPLNTFLLLISFQLTSVISSFAQVGNEWIVPGQTYFKIPVVKTGLYAVSFDQLAASGVPIKSSVMPEEIQLFYRGIEQAILVKNDSMFFYGKKNDGTLDSLLYQPASSQPNKYFNLYSDTSTYFLTWANGKNGKRMNISTISSSNSAELYHWKEELNVFAEAYRTGQKRSIETYMSYGDIGETWSDDDMIKKGTSLAYPINISNAESTLGLDAQIEIQLTGLNYATQDLQYIKNHSVDIILQNGIQSDLVFTIPDFSSFNIQTFSAKFPASFLSNANLKVVVSNRGSGYASWVSTNYIKVTYPQTYNFVGEVSKLYSVPSNSQSTKIAFNKPISSFQVFDISNTNDLSVIPTQITGESVEAVVKGGSKIFVATQSGYLKPMRVVVSPMTRYNNLFIADFIIISHKKIMEGAKKYAAFKASKDGGAHDTLIAEINNLYDLFSYGEKSPIAIKRFLSYIAITGKPKYVFIIGKGLIPNYNRTGLYTDGPYYRLNPEFYINHSDPTTQREDLIPPFGFPGSDWMYVMGMNGADPNIPTIAIGRLAARNNEEVEGYLDKVTVHTQTPNALWMKNLLHLSGGEYEGERDAFLRFVNELKGIAEDTIFGGKVVKTISKQGSSSIDNSLLSNISEVVNKGISMMTFYGHTTPDFTEIDFGFPSMDFYGYRNEGKYPLLYTNGCYSGQIFEWSSFAEDWVLTKKRGAIASIGHTNVGYTLELENYTRLFYKAAYDSREMIGKPVGDLQLKAIQSYAKQNLSDPSIATIQQMTLHGDPSIRIYMPIAPDLAIDDSKVSIKSLDGRTVTALSDSFALKLYVENLGLSFNDSVQVLVKRTISGKVITYGPITYRPINYSDTILFVIKSPDVSTFGENIFEVFIDPNDSIIESDELNNTAVLKYFIPVSGVVAIYPTEFSIVNSNPVTLVGQSTNLLSTDRAYYIEIDTSYLYNSPIRKDTIINATSLIKWNNMSLPYLRDSLVYYWRIRYNDLLGSVDTLWGESTFIYIKDSPEGWSQSEFPQFFKDQAFQMQRNIPSRSWSFTKNSTPIYARTVGNSYVRSIPDPYIFTPSMETVISVYGLVYSFRNFCDANAILAIAFDKASGKPYTKDFGKKCGVFGKEESVNLFVGLDKTTGQQQLQDYINDIPNGDVVLLVSTGEANFDSWSQTSLKTTIRDELGSDSVMNLTNGRPFILLAAKGENKPMAEITIPDSQTGVIELYDTLQATNSAGYITSTLIGPATSWGVFYHMVTSKDAPGIDDDSLMIIGVDITGKNIDTLAISQKDSLYLNTVSGLNNYPYIRLLARVSDNVNLTPPYLKKWQVIYSGVPEGSMNTGLFGVEQYNTVALMEGDSIKLCYAFENISNYSFDDSLYVRYTITNSNTGPKSELVKLSPLAKDSMLTFCKTVSTKGLEGNNIFQVYVNPQIQKEQYYNNNVLEMTFSVTKDKTHPILDVVFDGSHIMDGDIVSPNPQITITLNDENKFQIRNTMDGIEIYIQRPGQAVPEKVDPSQYTGKQIGVNGRNVFQIEFNPKSLPDGTYSLIVRASDLSGNASGSQDYNVRFEVINESTITHFYPYPNPFSTSTRFVFTLTGSDIPQDMIIQIMTVTGKVIREITKAEIGPIRIGNNKTEYAWDGRDEFGDKLANGVYLYRVLIKNEDNFKHRNTSGDKAFKKDWGKLYILR